MVTFSTFCEYRLIFHSHFVFHFYFQLFDSYVAVSGLPDVRKDHHIAMAKFAWDVLHKFDAVTRRMECQLGPDTSELAIRIGLYVLKAVDWYYH